MATTSPLRNKWLANVPAAYDIVTGYFPETKPKGELRLRPCLVLNVLEDEDGASYLRVAYGTRSLRLPLKLPDLVIQNHHDLNTVGLPMATRFSLDQKNIVDLPWSEEYFGCWKGYAHPRVGSLTEELIKEYGFCMMVRSHPDFR